ncbi:DUF1801 domain-containing protein [Devosia sp. 2618]|uniref:DUF1801 domain-containing protein n=1 Tax=Devosia sp. 2618 TaxID=3156454 RepID=UPI003392891E
MSADKISQWLDGVGVASPTNHATVLALRELVLAAAPSASEGFKYGGLHYSTARPFCGIFAFASHVTLEFSRGAELDDPAGVLLGDGQYRRHIRFKGPDAVNVAVLAPYIAQACALA